MPLWELTKERLSVVSRTSFQTERIREVSDLQERLRHQIEVIDPDLYVLCKEFSNWDSSQRRIDLLCIDRQANLVVIELKRDETAGHADLQAIRYAAMVAPMTFAQATQAHAAYLTGDGADASTAEERILEFLGWGAPNEDDFGQDVRIILVSADFTDRELTSAVLWLRDRGVDIRCIKMSPHRLDGVVDDARILLDVQQLIPVPEAADMLMKIAEKAQKQREAGRGGARDYRRFDVEVYGEQHLRQAKNRAALLVVRSAMSRGHLHSVDLIAISEEHEKEWFTPVIMGFPGELDTADFIARLEGVYPNSRTRYFCGPDDLITAEGHTWAFTNQWSGSSVEVLIGEIVHRFPAVRATYTVSE